MYQFKEYVKRENQFFVFDKSMVKDKIWANLPNASKSMFPVIASHCDASGKAFPSEATIAAIAGCDLKTVRKGIKGLCKLPGFEVQNSISGKGLPTKTYQLEPIPHKKGRTMPFYRTIFDSGCWMECTQSAQAIYPVMRTYSFTDADLYAELENLEEVGYDNFYPGNIRGEDDHYRNRRYDFCITPFEVLSEYSGISDPRTIKKAVADLETNFLVEYIGKIFATEETGFEPTPTWAVYRHPIQIFKREYLNEKITKRYKAYENHKHKYLLN